MKPVRYTCLLFSMLTVLLISGCGGRSPQEDAASAPAPPITPPKPEPPSTRISLVYTGQLAPSQLSYIADWMAANKTGEPYAVSWMNFGAKHIMTFSPVENREAFFATNYFLTVRAEGKNMYSVDIDPEVFEEFPSHEGR